MPNVYKKRVDSIDYEVYMLDKSNIPVANLIFLYIQTNKKQRYHAAH